MSFGWLRRLWNRFIMSASPSSSKLQKRELIPKTESNQAVKKPKKPKPKPKSARKNILSDEELNDADIHFENGLRKVRPYYYKFQVYVKERWFGKKLVDVMSTEFRTDLFYNHMNAINSGRMTVNGNIVSPDTILKNGDVIHHLVHRHECPVLADPIEIIADTDDMVVVNKPCSIPAHPCGRYRHNSLTYMLGRNHGMTSLRILYRLDRLTSGLMMFSKSHEKAEQLAALMVERAFKKTYLCRVAGRVLWEKAECHQPIEIFSKVHGVYQVSNKNSAKPSITKFERIYADEKSSIVKCFPLTGRTHQIRVHLQYLGHPILNDPIYHNYAWGQKFGKEGDYDRQSKDEILSALNDTFSMKRWVQEDSENPNLPFKPPMDMETPPVDVTSPYYDKNCGYCQFQFRDPSRSELTLFLHALRYEGPEFVYETSIPAWALPEYDLDDDDDVTVREAKLKQEFGSAQTVSQ